MFGFIEQLMSTGTDTREEKSIRIELAGRAYPLTIHTDEEENIRTAATEINESINRLKAGYPLTDKQDLLAMAALEVATRVLNLAKTQPSNIDAAVLDELDLLLKDLAG